MALFLYDKEISDANKTSLHTDIVATSKDSIFHVRQAVANSLTTLIQKFPEKDTEEIVGRLVNDVSELVRYEWVSNIVKMRPIPYKLLLMTIGMGENEQNDDEKEEDKAEDEPKTIESELKLLYQNSYAKIRKVVAENAVEICKTLNKGNFETLFSNLYKALINDKDKSIKIILMNHLGNQGNEISDLIDVHLLTDDLIESWKAMFDSNDWRDKSEVFSNFSNFAVILGKDEFTTQFLDFIKEGLSDRIYDIRRHSVATLLTWTETFGYEWFSYHILEYLYAFKSDRNYLHRQTPLFTFQALSKHIGTGSNLSKSYQLILYSSNNRVHNRISWW